MSWWRSSEKYLAASAEFFFFVDSTLNPPNIRRKRGMAGDFLALNFPHGHTCIRRPYHFVRFCPVFQRRRDDLKSSAFLNRGWFSTGSCWAFCRVLSLPKHTRSHTLGQSDSQEELLVLEWGPSSVRSRMHITGYERYLGIGSWWSNIASWHRLGY